MKGLTTDDIIFGLKCKGHLEVMNCDLCPYACYAPHCERYINEDAIAKLRNYIYITTYREKENESVDQRKR